MESVEPVNKVHRNNCQGILLHAQHAATKKSPGKTSGGPFRPKLSHILPEKIQNVTEKKSEPYVINFNVAPFCNSNFN